MSAAADAQSNVRVEKNTRDYLVGPPSNVPEGVIYDRGTRAFYGGSSTDGTLYKQTLDARPGQPAQVFLPAGAPDGRTAAYGVNVDDEGRLYVSGGTNGTLHVYGLKTRGLVARFDTGQGGFINDVTIAEDGDVYFTDSAPAGRANPSRHVIFRVTEEQVEAGGGAPEVIQLAPEVPLDEGFNANGIRAVDGDDEGDAGEGDDGDEDDGDDTDLILFDDLNSDALFRMKVGDNPAAREIRQIQVRGGRINAPDGLELDDDRTLYVINNEDELVQKVKLSEDYLRGRLVSNTTTPRFHTPTTASLAPGNRLLVSNAEFFDQSEPGPPYFVTSIPRP